MPFYEANNTMTNWHHIVPRHHNGPDTEDNLIELEHSEHVEAHRHLYLMSQGCAKCELAWRMMDGQDAESFFLSRSRANKGKPKSAAHRAKISAARKGKKYPKLAEAMRGKKMHPNTKARIHSPESFAKMAATKTGKKRNVIVKC